MSQPIMPELNDSDIITALRQGRSEALGQVYDKYAPVLLGLTTRMMGQPEAAEAVLHQTFVAIWKRRSEYENSRLSLLSWLILITRDTAMAALKEMHQTAFTNNAAGKNGINVPVKDFFHNLTPNEKAALDLVYLQGYTCQEAAAELNIPEETLKTWLKNASQHLREGRGK